MPNRTIKEIESYNYSQHNPIEDIKEKLKQLGYKVQPEILDQQNLNNFSRHLITFGNSDNAFDISIHRVDNNRYEVLAGELNKEEKHDLLLKIEAFQNIFAKLHLHHRHQNLNKCYLNIFSVFDFCYI